MLYNCKLCFTIVNYDAMQHTQGPWMIKLVDWSRHRGTECGEKQNDQKGELKPRLKKMMKTIKDRQQLTNDNSD